MPLLPTLIAGAVILFLAGKLIEGLVWLLDMETEKLRKQKAL